MRSAMIGVLAGLALASPVQGAVTVSYTSAPSSIPGYTKYTIAATAPVGEKVIGLENLVVTGEVAQVWTTTTGSTPLVEDLTSFFDSCTDEYGNRIDQPAVEQAWLDGDTHMLIWDRAVMFGPGIVEDKLGGVLPYNLPDAHDWENPTIRCREYIGSWGFSGATTLIVGTTQRANHLEFLQVVAAEGSRFSLSGMAGTDAPGAVMEPFGVPLTLPLVAHAGGPYSVFPGDSLELDGSGSDDPYGIASYEWDIGGDGVFETDAHDSPTIQVPYSYLTSLGLGEYGQHTIALRVTGIPGNTDTAYTTLTIVPEPATLSLLGAGAGLLLARRRR